MMSFLLWSIAVVVLSIYIRTLSHSIAGGDSGEIVAEGCKFVILLVKLGTAHPPGYPLITLIIYEISGIRNAMANILPNITVATCVNAFCALCTTIAATLIGLMVSAGKFSDLNRFGSQILAIGMFAFSPLIWQYAITAEVFPLNTMFTSVLLWLTLEFSQTKKLNYVMLGAFACGLALCNQHTILLYIVPLVLWILFLCRRLIFRSPLLLIQLGGCFLIGFSFYLYLPIAATFNEVPGSWGHVTDIQGLLHHFLRKDYGTFQLFSGSTGKKVEGFWERTDAYISDITYRQSVYPIIPFLSIVGALGWAIASISYSSTGENQPGNVSVNNKANYSTSKNSSVNRKKKASASPIVLEQKLSQKDSNDVSSESYISTLECSFTPLVFIITQLFYFGVFHNLANLPLNDKLLFGVHQRFWMQPNVLLYLWAGFGFGGVFFCIEKLSIALLWLANRALSKTALKPNVYSTVSVAVQSLSIPAAIFLVFKQYSTFFERMDHSGVNHFSNYAAAVLDPLPENAVLLVNYDQQWTSVRYKQQCEGFRTDVTAINLSMMTYQWFQTKRRLYPNLTFPGTFHTYPTSAYLKTHNAFTLVQFLDANSDKHAIFLGGKYGYSDPQLDRLYDSVPVGLVTRLLPNHLSPNGTSYLASTVRGWKNVFGHLPTLPDVKKFPEETWEWTIGRDFKDRVIDTAAYMLIAAIKSAKVDAKPLVYAVYWLETAYWLEGEECGSALLKNAGLSHVHLIQNKILKTLKPPTVDLFHSLSAIDWPPANSDWKAWSGRRFEFFWGEFLKRPDAVKDPQYETIRKMYETAMSAKSK